MHPAGLAAPTESEIRFGRDYAFVHAQYRFQSLVTLIFITRSVDFRRVPSRIQAQPVVEKRRVAETYDYATSGIDYSEGTSHLVSGSHYVKCTDEEFAKWCK